MRAFVDAYKRKHPSAKISISDATVERSFQGRVHFDLKLGGHDALRSCIKSALTLIAYAQKPELGLEQAWTYVHDGERAGAPNIYFSSAPAPWVPTRDLGPLPHLIAVVSDRASRTIKMQMRFFGDIVVASTLARDVDTRDWRVGYAVDPFEGAEEQTDAFEGDVGEPADKVEQLFGPMKLAGERIMQVGQARSADMVSQRIATEVIGRHLGKLREGDLIPDETLAAIAHDVAQELVRHKYRIDTTVADPDLLARAQQHAAEHSAGQGTRPTPAAPPSEREPVGNAGAKKP